MQSNTQAIPAAPSIRLPEVRKICGNVSASTIWSWAKNSSKTGFPRPYRLSDNCTVWNRAEIEEWLRARMVASRNQQAAHTKN